MILYYSSNCPNCTRLINIMRRIPSIAPRAMMKNIDTMPPAQLAGLQYVPTLVDDNGRQHVGTAAFEFLKPFHAEMELDPAPIGKGLEFSSLDGPGEAEYMEDFGEIVDSL